MSRPFQVAQAACAILLLVAADANATGVVLVDSGGFESLGDGNLAPFPVPDPFVPGTWFEASLDAPDNGPESSAVVQSTVTHPVYGGSKSVKVTREANDDAYWFVPRSDFATPLSGLVVIEWDMLVETGTSSGGLGPWFGVTAYDGGAAPLTIGGVGVDAVTGEILYQTTPAGEFSSVPGIDVDNGWHQFRMAIDYDNDLYQAIFDGQLLFTEPIVSDGVTGLSDADIATVASFSDAASQAAEGVAYFDNFVVVNFDRVEGDYDVDGDVDLNDYLVWEANYGAASLAFAGADGNGDGVVDAADYTVWRDNYTAPASAVTSTPEPAGFAIACGGLLLAATRRRRW